MSRRSTGRSAWRCLVPGLVLALLLSGCDSATTPGVAGSVAAHVRITDVGGPRGRPGNHLPLPIEATVVGPTGIPLPGVRVSWHSQNGLISPLSGVTDEDGTVVATFELGYAPGEAVASAVIPNVDSASVSFQVRDDTPEALPYDMFLPVSVTTPDGSGEVVHPDLAIVSYSLPYQLAITPYPNGNQRQEQPVVFASAGGLDWTLQAGAPNPVVPPPTQGYTSDPDVVYNSSTREIWLYYRYVDTANVILLTRSPNGITWSKPNVVVTAPNHEIISPAVVRRGAAQWLMWSVNGGTLGCIDTQAWVELRRSSNGIDWSEPKRLALDAAEFFPWHIDVQWIASRQEYWALFNAKAAGSCTTPVLFLASSPDGVNWTRMPRPVATRGDTPEFRDIVYRSTFRYDPDHDDIWLWISGARHRRQHWSWTALQERRHRADLMDGSAAARTPGTITVSRHQLTDWP